MLIFFINEDLINTFFHYEFLLDSKIKNIENPNFFIKYLTPNDIDKKMYFKIIPENFVGIDVLNTNDYVVISKIYEQVFKSVPTDDIKENCTLMREIIINHLREITQDSFLNFWNQVLIERSIKIENFVVTDKQADFLTIFLTKLIEKGFVNIQIFFPEDPSKDIICNFYSSIMNCRKILFDMELEIFKNDFLTNHFFYQPNFIENLILTEKKTDGGVLSLINLIYFELDYLEKFVATETCFISNQNSVNLFEFIVKTGQANNYYYIYYIKLFLFLDDLLIRIFWYVLTFYFTLGLTFKYCFRKESIFGLWYLESFLLTQFILNLFYFFYLMVFLFFIWKN